MASTTRSKNNKDPNALYRGAPAPVPKVRAVSPTNRLLKPTQASLAASRKKVLTGKAKEIAEARAQTRKRRQLDRMAKENGRVTIPRSPEFCTMESVTLRSRADTLTRTSRELLEIAAIRKRVESQKRKTKKYHDSTTYGAAKKVGKSDEFFRTFTASGGVGLPAVRSPKLTTPVGFELKIDKRVSARRNLKRQFMDVVSEEVWQEVQQVESTEKKLKSEEDFRQPTRKLRRKLAPA
ncbi:hypothetical protein PsorP6_000799 [Peronosclerospora sorghi]|uniref:Uncharacterized protein n=1 Tax=Peronosclerospora sorghi TaxID=230839 RepID=A0ACC0WRJ3_9STRA|nr:hypothetical protein PsorP6_000799 [Peronosclerospora sorghi]